MLRTECRHQISFITDRSTPLPYRASQENPQPWRTSKHHDSLCIAPSSTAPSTTPPDVDPQQLSRHNEPSPPTPPLAFDHTIPTSQRHSPSDEEDPFQRLAHRLSRFVASCLSPNNPMQHVPTDAEIQNQARWIVFDDDDPCGRTAADRAKWLAEFKLRAGLW
ncbi:hypothetical protein MMC26_002102 [Xylographa opegraphella]|nr:hypothetical protein [Xylographa opegraphella]